MPARPQKKTSTAAPDITRGALPSSRKITVAGEQHPGVQVAMREIALAAGSHEKPVTVYDTSRPLYRPQCFYRHSQRTGFIAS